MTRKISHIQKNAKVGQILENRRGHFGVTRNGLDIIK